MMMQMKIQACKCGEKSSFLYEYMCLESGYFSLCVIVSAIALLQARAVGKRVKILWSHDNEFFGGTITNFDPLSFTHSVLYDDADEDPGLQMWREIIISI